MATLLENIERSVAVYDRMVQNIETKGVAVPTDITAEEQADKILDISSGTANVEPYWSPSQYWPDSKAALEQAPVFDGMVLAGIFIVDDSLTLLPTSGVPFLPYSKIGGTERPAVGTYTFVQDDWITQNPSGSRFSYVLLYAPTATTTYNAVSLASSNILYARLISGRFINPVMIAAPGQYGYSALQALEVAGDAFVQGAYSYSINNSAFSLQKISLESPANGFFTFNDRSLLKTGVIILEGDIRPATPWGTGASAVSSGLKRLASYSGNIASGNQFGLFHYYLEELELQLNTGIVSEITGYSLKRIKVPQGYAISLPLGGCSSLELGALVQLINDLGEANSTLTLAATVRANLQTNAPEAIELLQSKGWTLA